MGLSLHWCLVPTVRTCWQQPGNVGMRFHHFLFHKLFLSTTMAAQKDGCYPRLNGAMIQSQQYNGMVASVVGKLINSTTLQAADGTNLTLGTDYLQDGLVNNPDMCVEIIGQVVDATSMTVRKPFLKINIALCCQLHSTIVSIFRSTGICRSGTFHRYGFGLVQSNACRSTLTRLFSVLSQSYCRCFQLVVQFMDP
jgi:hypothetical protein